MESFKSHSIASQSPVFALAAHPSEPLFTVGLLSGHVYTYTWPKEVPSDDDDQDEAEASGLPGGYKVAWKTRRHKGSCRSAAYSLDGQVLYTVGTDSLLKCASTATGQVTSKSLIPSPSSTSSDSPTHIHPLNPHHLLLGTDSGTIHLYDTRSSLPSKPATTWTSIHEDYISSITSLPPTAESTSNMPKQFVATGDSTLSYLDVRKGLIQKSDDQENETLTSCIVSGVGKGGRSTRAYVGMGDGIIHAFERGVWGDMCERIKIGGKGDDVDCVEGYIQDGDPEVGKGKCIVAGCGDGTVKVVRLGGNKVVRVFEHGAGEDGEEEGVTAIKFDCDGSMITAGGSVVKIWYQDFADTKVDEGDDDKKKQDDGDSDSESDSDDDDKPSAKSKGRKLDSDSDDSDEPSGSKSSQRRKKKRKNKHQGAGPKKSLFSGLD
ncbi:WD repeat-containing protein jip5 [Arthrobotrys musiformis]|uniref:WD repeat-containing protein JIP5 n=1 Tax=Arthrobotrys musiformis TaxID=47236 RepID=A0AAV9W4L6_9PEZI